MLTKVDGTFTLDLGKMFNKLGWTNHSVSLTQQGLELSQYTDGEKTYTSLKLNNKLIGTNQDKVYTAIYLIENNAIVIADMDSDFTFTLTQQEFKIGSGFIFADLVLGRTAND